MLLRPRHNDLSARGVVTDHLPAHTAWSHYTRLGIVAGRLPHCNDDVDRVSIAVSDSSADCNCLGADGDAANITFKMNAAMNAARTGPDRTTDGVPARLVSRLYDFLCSLDQLAIQLSSHLVSLA